MVGVALGLTPSLVYVASVLRGLGVDQSVGIDPVSLLTLYGVSAVLAYCAALLTIWLVLRAAGDGLAGRTTRCTAWLLPVGTVAATGLGVGAAWLYDFTTHAYTVAVVAVVVTSALSLTFAMSRSWALRERAVTA